MGGGRTTTTVTRTLQYAADTASSRNGQQMSAKSLHRRWKHEIQIALLRRRAAMARAVLLNPSARAQWLFPSIIDRALHHWRRVLALDGGPVTTASLTLRLTQQYQMTTLSLSLALRMSLCSLQVSSCHVCPPCGGGCFRPAIALPRKEQGPHRLSSVSFSDNLHLENSFEDNGVSGQLVLACA